MDFKDLKDAYDNNKENIKFKSIDFQYKECQNDNKLEILKEKFKELQMGPIEDLRDPKIKEAFEKALSSEFEIVVMAPMSSGKSTLINAILGTDLLPAYNTATTATMSRIKDIDGSNEFTVSCTGSDGRQIYNNKSASTKLIDDLNKKADKEKNIDCINIQGNIPNIPSDKVNVVFVDTPGGNNSQDKKHKEVMKRALNNENKGMILFVFNYTQLETDDSDAILSMAASAIRNSTTGKQARDRFIFVCNKMDEQDSEEEPLEKILEKVKKNLKDKGIEDPNIFFTSADLCKLIRMKKAGQKMSESDEARLKWYLRPFNRENRRLFLYDSISETKKNEYEKFVKEKAELGEKRNIDVAEINSGIPALEEAIKLYIEKYAEAIKVKTLYDVFMKRAEELDMKAKCEQKWASSQEEYECMRKELKEKRIAFEEDKNRQLFKQKIDNIEADYSQVDKIRVEMLTKLMDLSSEYTEKQEVEQAVANEIMKSFKEEVLKLAKKGQEELEIAFDSGIYRECRTIFTEYEQYIKEIDSNNLLNVGDYNFRKTEEFSSLSEKKDMFEKKFVYIKQEPYSEERPGILAAMLRYFGFSRGWDKKTKEKNMVKIKEVMKEKIAGVVIEIDNNVEKEINRAREQAEQLKKEAKIKLDDIDDLVRAEYRKIQETTENQKKLKDRVEKNKKDKEWLRKFIDEMKILLEI